MGHHGGNGVYEKLGARLDKAQLRIPWNETFHAILKELYSVDEADLVTKMPYGLSKLGRVAQVSGVEEGKVRKLLDSLCAKGLVMDLDLGGDFYYTVSPIVIGIFEFTMMRTSGVDSRKCAGLFEQYMTQGFFDANFGHGESATMMRALPHEEAIKDRDHLEILDYESAIAMVEQFDSFSIGLCSCRHKSLHTGEKRCEIPLEKCSSFGRAADYLVRNKLARRVSKAEMLDNIRHSKENALVLNADNVRRNITYICHCCKDCCIAMKGIRKYGYPKSILTSSFIAHVDDSLCVGCGRCSRTCGIGAIEMVPTGDPRRKKAPQLAESICLGCGACALKCEKGAMRLVHRGKRVIPPESTFERVILMHLDRGTLPYQMFDDPRSVTHQFMRGFLGGFLRLAPVKRALMSDALRSSFLDLMKTGVKRQGKGFLLEM